MQSTSTAWKQTLGCFDYADRPYFVPVSFIEIKHTMDDPDAQADATATDNGHESYSNTAQITDGQDKTFVDFATLEWNNIVLDGRRNGMPSTITDDTGFTGDAISDDECEFATNPLITITFSQVWSTSVPGITIKWSEAYGQWASDFVVKVYNGGTVLNTYTVTDNTDITWSISDEITGYDKITIEVTKWCLPHSRARIEEVIVGLIKIWDKSDIISFNAKNSADLLSLTLPSAHIEFEIDNVNGAWNPDNPTGMYQYLINRQEIKVRYGYKINNSVEWINGGTFYMSDWTTPANGITATFKADDLMSFMRSPYTVSATSITLYNLATDAFTQANLPTNDDGSNKWDIDNSLQSITVTLPADFGATLQEVVQLCANAAQCVIRIDRNGAVHIEPLDSTLTDYLIDQFVSYEYAEIEMSAPLRTVNVNDGMGTATESADGENQEITNELIQNGTVAGAVATWVKGILSKRRTISGSFRADPRGDVLDLVKVENKYAENQVYLTELNLTYNGAFRGSYKGRVIL